MTQNEKNITPGSDEFDKQLGERAPEWLHKIGNRFNLGVLIIAPNNYILFRNKSFIEHCGLPDELIEKSKKFDDWLRHMTERGDFTAMETDLFVDQFLKKVHSDQSDELIVTDITPPNGNILQLKFLGSQGGFVTVFSEDVTQEKRNEESLQLALEMGKSGYFYHIFDTDETIIQSSYLQHILIPSEFDSIKQKGFWPLLHPGEVEGVKTIWRNVVLNGKSTEVTARLNTAQHGSKIFSFYLRPIKSSTGKLLRIICFFEDVTYEHNARKALRNAKESTESALKSKTQFLARISHEIRTPMNAVIGIADALIHHNHNPEIVPKLDLIQSSAGSILNILDDTLNHSKLESDEFTLDPKPAEPGKTVRNVCLLWDSKAQENNVKLTCQVDDSVPNKIIFDNFRFEQCLNNLLSNAIKFSAGGKIDVIATRVDKNGAANLLVAVRDTGIGMTEEQKTRIFEPFKQGDESIKRRFGGTGLGMNITKSLIERMGGSISVKSEIGKGSIFVLTLPIKLQDSTQRSPSEALFEKIMDGAVAQETPYERLNVLVADDNPTNHTVIKSLLHGVVADVYTADDGKEVVDILKVQNIDIVLMDIHMPVMDGIESTLAIRSSDAPWSDVKIIAVTADPEYQQKRLCLNIGMDFAVAKPVRLVDLLEAFDEVLEISSDTESFKKTG